MIVVTGTNLSDFEWILYPFYLSLFPAWFGLAVSVPAGGLFISFFGMPALALLYPLASYYLWHRNRAAWIAALAVSLLTVALDTYFLLVESIAPLLVSGIIFNLLIACVLWRGRGNIKRAPEK
jgi:lysylphosphatidylglycerol synthetase-like protein (DUF2156 family)